MKYAGAHDGWPCRCFECIGDASCGVCGAPEGQICETTCSEHPSNRAPCEALERREMEPKIAKGEQT